MKYIRIAFAALSPIGIYVAGYCVDAPHTWHQGPDIAMGITLFVGGIMAVTFPSEYPWEKK